MDWSNFNKIILLFPLLLVSCGENNISDIQIESQYNIQEPILIEEVSYLQNKLNNKDSFLLFIYSHSCDACEFYIPMVNNYIKENEVVFYSIDVGNENTALRPTNGVVDYIATPTICLFDKGNIVFKANPDTIPEVFTSSTSMANYINKFAYVSSFKNINSESDLDLLINDNTEKIIYYYYPKCGDCSYFNLYYLDEFFNKRNQKIVYKFDMTYYFDNREDSSSPIYKNFTDKYGLSYDGNNKYGYKNGVVPTFQKYKGNKLVDTKIIFNDEYEIIYDEKNEVDGIKIISSYYKNNSFIGKTFKRSDKETAFGVYHKETLNYYIKKFKQII